MQWSEFVLEFLSGHAPFDHANKPRPRFDFVCTHWSSVGKDLTLLKSSLIIQENKKAEEENRLCYPHLYQE